jgi:hypothetical protein
VSRPNQKSSVGENLGVILTVIKEKKNTGAAAGLDASGSGKTTEGQKTPTLLFHPAKSRAAAAAATTTTTTTTTQQQHNNNNNNNNHNNHNNNNNHNRTASSTATPTPINATVEDSLHLVFTLPNREQQH